MNTLHSCIRRLVGRGFATASKVNYTVYLSQSHDVYTNLALEDWIYAHVDFSQQQLLMLWQNNPCVVIGRHQNPWMEANLPYLHQQGISMARRNSGGGCVYHDLGNLNLTFFTNREQYNREGNLQLICDTLRERWGVGALMNQRKDITLNGFKVSGTASKLGRNIAYHHCTLLLSADTHTLHHALNSNKDMYSTKATASVSSPVCTLQSQVSGINMQDLMVSVGERFLNKGEAAQQQGFHKVNPTNSWFQDLRSHHSHLSSWDWVYGHTPPFTARHPGDMALCVTKGVVSGVEGGDGEGLVGRRYSSNMLQGEEDGVGAQPLAAVQGTTNNMALYI